MPLMFHVRQLYDCGTQGATVPERRRIQSANLIALIGMGVSLLYCAMYALWLHVMPVAWINAACVLGYGSNFWLAYRGHVKAARLALHVVFMLQMASIVLLYMTRHSGLQWFLLVSGPLSFLMFGHHAQGLRYLTTGMSIALFLACEYLPINTRPPDLSETVMWLLKVSTMPFSLGVVLMVQWFFLREIDARQIDLIYTAEHDGLTGLFNRRSVFEQAQHLWQQAQQQSHPFSVMMVDIDHFKAVNDTLGHSAGDELLRQTAQGLNKGLAVCTPLCEALLGRIGGEEFLVVLPHHDAPASLAVAEYLREQTARTTTCTVSIGIACAPAGHPFSAPLPPLDTLVRQADHALYQAKALGRNRCETYHDAASHP